MKKRLNPNQHDPDRCRTARNPETESPLANPPNPETPTAGLPSNRRTGRGNRMTDSTATAKISKPALTIQERRRAIHLAEADANAAIDHLLDRGHAVFGDQIVDYYHRCLAHHLGEAERRAARKAAG